MTRVSADPDGLRAAAARTDSLADELAVPAGTGGASGTKPTASAVRRIDITAAGIRAMQSRKLTSSAKILRDTGDSFEDTDLGSADNMRNLGDR
ncbi:hypothetical protein [Mycobacterium sp. D16R24]|uniref:hypothetical protein n=1 Tax=Mycobacterium sp. D16R24 TaxID=1855656 RepID=UPI0011170826|nr:hypothetical protein [Mycobacterium sp. D16R24]